MADPYNTPNINPLGASIPPGYLLGRVSQGHGPQELVSIADIGRMMAALGIVAVPGTPSTLVPIANQRVLGNGSGGSATPVALSISQPGAGLTVSWAIGGITLALADDLAGVEGLSTTGIAARTAASTWATRTITGTANQVDVSNGDGVAGNPTLTISATYAGQASITTLGTVATGTWQATKIGLAYGGTNADLSATGGASQFLRQNSAGAAVTVIQPTYADIASGSTTATATGLTIADGVLSGDTDLPSSGHLTTDGRLGLGASPNAVLELQVSYSGANSSYAQFGGTLASSVTTLQRVLYFSTTCTPTGATLNNLFGVDSSLTVGASTPTTITTAVASRSIITLDAAFTGTVTTHSAYLASSPVINGGSITNQNMFNAATTATNDGKTTGTSTLRQFFGAGITSSANGGTINSRCVEVTVPSGGATAGTNNNRGIYITGNGGTAAGGTVNNFAVFCDSTAPWQFAAAAIHVLGGVTSSFPAFKRNLTVFEHRLGDDSAYGPVAASEVRQYGGENGQYAAHKSKTELTTIAAAATTDTTITIPANALVFAVSVRVVTAIPTATTFDWGIAGATTRYGTGASTAANTTSPGTIDAMRYYAAATAIRITPNLTPAAATGQVRVTIHYLEVTPPTS